LVADKIGIHIDNQQYGVLVFGLYCGFPQCEFMETHYCACYACNLALKITYKTQITLIFIKPSPMKKVILLTAIMLFSGLNGLLAQHPQINPIPCFGYQLTALNTGFQESKMHGTPTREKRDMEVVISTSSTNPIPEFARVWVVKDNGAVVLGPFTIFVDEPLTVPIDNGQWGVIIRSDFDLITSVWID
jgi:hypothetical protein